MVTKEQKPVKTIVSETRGRASLVSRQSDEYNWPQLIVLSDKTRRTCQHSRITSLSAATSEARDILVVVAIPRAAKCCGNVLKAEVKRNNLTPLVRSNKAGCLDQCEHGPTVAIYPQAIFYAA